jgi:hypothetical protein
MSYATIEAGLCAYLKDKLSIPVCPNLIPSDKTLPACTYTIQSDVEGMTHSGPTGQRTAMVEISFYAQGEQSYLAAKTLAATARPFLNGITGNWDNLNIQGMFIEDGDDQHDLDPALVSQKIDFSKITVQITYKFIT